MRKSVLILFLSMALFAGIFSINAKNVAQASSQAEIAMELTTGKILSQNKAQVKLPMASTTKIMTAIVIIEDCSLDEVITVPDKAVGVEGSSIYLKRGEQIDIRDLLYGLMLRSGNDSAAALAIHHSGSIEGFAAVMNEFAKKIGANNTNFKNPSGLPDPEHYTTATDLCKIACYAMQNETFNQIVSTKEYKGNFRSYTNKNKMLRLYEGATGIKTGYTVNAGRCLVSSAQRDNMSVVCVVLNCPDMYERSGKLLDYCFNNYKLLNLSTEKVFKCGKLLCKLKDNSAVVVKRDGNIRYKINRIDNPENDEVAELNIYDENDLLFSRKLFKI